MQANILLCETYITTKEDLFQRARTFQDSPEACYKKDHPQVTGSQVLLPQYYEEVLSCYGICDAKGVQMPPWQGQRNLLSLDERFIRAHNSGCIALIPAAFCIVAGPECLDMG